MNPSTRVEWHLSVNTPLQMKSSKNKNKSSKFLLSPIRLSQHRFIKKSQKIKASNQFSNNNMTNYSKRNQINKLKSNYKKKIKNSRKINSKLSKFNSIMPKLMKAVTKTLEKISISNSKNSTLNFMKLILELKRKRKFSKNLKKKKPLK